MAYEPHPAAQRAEQRARLRRAGLSEADAADVATRMGDADAAYGADVERTAELSRHDPAAIEVAARAAPPPSEATKAALAAAETARRLATSDARLAASEAYERGAGSRLDAEQVAHARASLRERVEAMPVTWAAEVGASVRDDGSGPPPRSTSEADEYDDYTHPLERDTPPPRSTSEEVEDHSTCKGCGRPRSEHTHGVFCP